MSLSWFGQIHSVILNRSNDYSLFLTIIGKNIQSYLKLRKNEIWLNFWNKLPLVNLCIENWNTRLKFQLVFNNAKILVIISLLQMCRMFLPKILNLVINIHKLYRPSEQRKYQGYDSQRQNSAFLICKLTFWGVPFLRQILRQPVLSSRGGLKVDIVLTQCWKLCYCYKKLYKASE